MQRTVDKFAGVHRQRAVLALPATVAKGQVTQAQVEVGYRPVRSLQAGIGHVQAANLQREGTVESGEEIQQRFGALQADLIQTLEC